MTLRHFWERYSMKNKNLYYKLNIIFALFFLFPVMGFLFFAVKYNALDDEYLPHFFLGVLVFSLLGLYLLRKLFDEISLFSKSVAEKAGEFSGGDIGHGANEIQNLVDSFSAIEGQFSTVFKRLEKKSSEVSILKELSELCYVTFDPEEIMHVTLERSMMLAGADIGSVLLLLPHSEPRKFEVKATIGLGDRLQIGDSVDFESSVAKYAVINKSPLVVEDVEKDRRFGRINRAHYGTKSFICMPIKTSKDIVGVLTLSRRNPDSASFCAEDVEALAPLLSNAAFTFENMRLIRQNEQNKQVAASVDRIFKIINSSFQEKELVHAVLGEIKSIIPYSFAVVLMRDEKRPGQVVLMDLYANGPVNLAKGAQYVLSDGCIVDQVCRQESSMVLEDTSVLTHEFERRLFVNRWSRSCVFAPLKIRGTVRGVLALAGKEKDVEEFYRAQSFIDWMAGGLSLAIERNNLSSMVLRRNQELDTIRQIGSALASSTFDLNQVLKYTMDMIRMVMNVDAGSLYLLEEDELRFAVSFNIAVEALQRVSLKLGQGIAGYVAARGESLIVNDTTSSRHFYPEVDKNTGFNTRSALCVPMISQGRVIGVIEVLNKLNGDFTSKDEDLLQSIAASVSIAIENSRLYRETVSMAENERGIRRVFQKFVPREILDKILYGDDADKTVLEEFKTLTLLNIDIRGFSSFSKRIGPQKTVAQLNEFFSAMGSIVVRYGGIVDKYLGDGFLALFGAPVSGTRDAENAVDAALEMQEKVVEFADFWGEDFGHPLEIGISIHTGEVVVGNIGFDRKMDYTVIGDAVNEVFRLQRMAKIRPNAVVLSESTRRAARSRLEVEQMEIPEDLRTTFGDMPIYELQGKVGE